MPDGRRLWSQRVAGETDATDRGNRDRECDDAAQILRFAGLWPQPSARCRARVNPQDARGVGDEVRQRVDVVVVALAVTVIDDVLDAADLDACSGRDRLHVGNHLSRRREGFDAQVVFRRIGRACAAVERDTVAGLANINGAQVETLARGLNVDGVQEAAVQHFDARDVATAGGNVFLHQRGLIKPYLQTAFRRRALKVPRRVKPDDAGVVSAWQAPAAQRTGAG